MLLIIRATCSILLLFLIIVSSCVSESRAYYYQSDKRRNLQTCSDGLKRDLVWIEKDGNCLFRSISYCLWDDEKYHANVRSSIVDHVVANWSEYEVHVQHDHSIYSHDRYKAYMSQDEKWGGEVEITAATKVYHRNFHIYNNVEDYITIKNGNQSVCALYYNGNHYFIVEDQRV